jgi:hypothetical protein
MKTQTNPTSGADAFHAWASGAKEKTPEEKARDAQYSAARPNMEEEFDRVSKENYERIDREVIDAMKETDMVCKKADIRSGHAPLTYKERKAVRELIGWQERLLVWMFRIAFLTFMYMYWHVTDVRIRQSMERIDSLEEKVEQLNGICNPTNLFPEAICFDDSTMIARN